MTSHLHHQAEQYDQTYGLTPMDEELKAARQQVLEQLAVVEHGLSFRYIPAGAFLMGSDSGDPDEQPVHHVELDGFWMSDTPITWATYCALMGWEEPRAGVPRPNSHAYKILVRYCLDETLKPPDWDMPISQISLGENGESLKQFDTKPMVAVLWEDIHALCERLSTATAQYRLPTEAEWEKAARGGLVQARYAWGNEPPDNQKCDYDHFGMFHIRRPRDFAPNGYGLYGMCGGVWEWTSDWYDAEYYRNSPLKNPTGPAEGEEKVLRGGSWADCAEAITVSYRMSWQAEWQGSYFHLMTPNIGFRLCRVER